MFTWDRVGMGFTLCVCVCVWLSSLTRVLVHEILGWKKTTFLISQALMRADLRTDGSEILLHSCRSGGGLPATSFHALHNSILFSQLRSDTLSLSSLVKDDGNQKAETHDTLGPCSRETHSRWTRVGEGAADGYVSADADDTGSQSRLRVQFRRVGRPEAACENEIKRKEE